MRTRSIKGLSVLGALTLGMLAGDPAWAQTSGTEKPLMYTYVSTWAVPRAMWGDYQKSLAVDDEALSKAVAEGTLTGFGDYSIFEPPRRAGHARELVFGRLDGEPD